MIFSSTRSELLYSDLSRKQALDFTILRLQLAIDGYTPNWASISHHASCLDNYWDALSRLRKGRNQKEIEVNEAQNKWVKDQGLEMLVNDLCSNSNVFPDPIHLFPDDSMTREYVQLEAMRDVVFVLSVCPRYVPRLDDSSREKHCVVYYEVLLKGRGEQRSGQGG